MGIPQSRLPIAYIELIAVLVGFSVFAKNYSNQLVTLYSDGRLELVTKKPLQSGNRF